ncbi:MAG: dockerin type I domain-containing protein [Desulfatirhabdiaceae bacterium]
MMRRFNLYLMILFCLIAVIGCKLTITLFDAPAPADTGSVITLTISGTAQDTGDGATEHGVVLQLPAGWSVHSAIWDMSLGLGLVQDVDIASQYTAESGHFIWAGKSIQTGSGDRNVTVTIKVLTGNSGGSYNLKAVVGAKRNDVWITDDPADVFDFSAITAEPYVKNITVTQVGDTTAPAPITSMTANVYYIGTTPHVTLDWTGYDEDAQGDVVMYHIYRSASSFTSVSEMVPVADVPHGQYTYDDADVVSGNEYFYAVTAIDELGNENSEVIPVSFYVQTPGSIHGTLLNNGEPITGEWIEIEYATDSACDSPQWGGVNVDSSTGDYTITGLLPGTYYLRTRAWGPNYIMEWWADPESVRNCENADSIVIDPGQEVFNKNFQLDLGGTISGTISDSVGTPITENISIGVYSGDPCGSKTLIASTQVNQDGTYQIIQIPSGTYSIRAGGNFAGYINEWYAGNSSTWECSDAQSLSITEGQSIPDINFQLDPGITISGTIFESDGTIPLINKDMLVGLVKGDPCGSWEWLQGSWINNNGTYTIFVNSPGTYHLLANGDGQYTSEWWASPYSVWSCGKAQSITVNVNDKLNGIDFQLDPWGAILGDVNSDGLVDLEDIVMILTVLSGDNTLSVNIEADVNGDEKIGMAEVIYILQKIAGLIVE